MGVLRGSSDGIAIRAVPKMLALYAAFSPPGVERARPSPFVDGGVMGALAGFSTLTAATGLGAFAGGLTAFAGRSLGAPDRFPSAFLVFVTGFLGAGFLAGLALFGALRATFLADFPGFFLAKAIPSGCVKRLQV